MPKLCEKCGGYDPTPTLTYDARCPSCGAVYSLIPGGAARDEVRVADAKAAALEPSVYCTPWHPIDPIAMWSSIAAAGLLFVILLFDQDAFVFLLDHANLAFHEAGHLFFGLLGSSLGLYGGTLGQLVFPIAAALSFWRRRQAIGAALSGVWLFENFLNIARYMADARAQILPLVGGGEHDWYHIFSRWGLLNQDTTIAGLTQALGWLGMAGCMLWLFAHRPKSGR